MDKKYMCYCGLYCENCATKAKVEPAARLLHTEMIKAGFEDIVCFLPDGEAFWRFLKGMAEEGTCVSCQSGSGNPGCEIRKCAVQNEVSMCALCQHYPCERISGFLESYPILKKDNALLRDEGMEAWAKLQDERKNSGYTYSEGK